MEIFPCTQQAPEEHTDPSTKPVGVEVARWKEREEREGLGEALWWTEEEEEEKRETPFSNVEGREDEEREEVP
jgi:hypothetical protein